MIIENLRTLSDTLLFDVKMEEGDPNATTACWGCPFERNGCSRDVDGVKNRISARVNLKSLGVVNLTEAVAREVKCGAGTDIFLKKRR